ncbi:uncharacterized protein LOC131690075 [Topomyia yanbarensis]|uniref:uncharacterized protein LOC131690075 n=1 Tax=Topomyia yanbarensis TaxID=2498891 RepID=UPI00273C18B0|nr:uncharacterized protein LOC131690075 [Topomyia yanbarensis]
MFSSLSSYIWSTPESGSPLEEINFTINGKVYKANSKTVPIDTSLNTFIRNHAHLTGTKFMCLEGGCGACIVNMNGVHPVTKEKTSWAVNSCLLPVFACHGLDVLTIEGIGNKKEGYHPAQQRLAHFNGTQCGYCSPGIVMNMYSLLESKKGQVSMEEIENSFGGNICRCTGYRPILDAFKSLAVDADKDLLEACRDIEDLTKTCPKTGSPCAGKCSAIEKTNTQQPIRMVFENDSEWYKVYNSNDIFAIFDKIGAKPYMLVAGNTAHGVYRRSENLQVFIDISSVGELHSHSLGNELIVGGNVTLTEFMDILTDASNKNDKFSYCKELVKHIDLIANVPVRNAGTIAGNLSIKNQHHEFPSDIYLILEAAGATLTIAESGGKISTCRLLMFVQMNMNKKIIKSVTLPALDPSVNFFRSYKIMPRAQNAHAYVNGAFLLTLNSSKNCVERARICLGGINPNFTHAKNTEKLLVDKNPFENSILQSACNTLSAELDPDWILPDASSEYRKNLAVSLFYKFILCIAPQGQVNLKPEYKSGGTVMERPLSSGKQTFDTHQNNWPLTKNIPKIEALAQTTGEAKFSNDLPPQPGELYAAFVLATQANSRIAKIDPSNALKMPGVVGLFSAKDIPGVNNFMSAGLGNQDVEEILCSGQVRFHGQPAGVIVAETFNLAQKAANEVNITYEKTSDKSIYPTLKSIMNVDAHDRFFDVSFDKRGKSYRVAPTATAIKTIKGRFEIAGQYHFTMETQTCVCVPIEDGMDVYSSTQWMDLTQVAIAESLKLPQNSLNLHVRRLGGGYGAKISRATQVACACALAAHLTHRPVRFVLKIEENMRAIGKRYGCISDYEVDVEKTGKITKMNNHYAQDYGVSLNESVQGATTEFFKNCYDAKTWKTVGKAVRTDAPSNTWCRAPGTTEGVAMIENIMEHIAHEMGLDPLEVRMANMTSDNKMQQLMPQFRKDVQFDERKRVIDEFNASNRWKKRGIAIVPMQYLLDYFGQLNAIVSIYAGDGTVSVTHGGIEMGQGMNTKVAQVTAFALGIGLEKVSVKPSTSLTSPNAIVTGGSMTSEAVCYAVKKACDMLLDRMKPVREANHDAPWEMIVKLSYVKNIDLCAEAQYKAEDLKSYYIWGLSCAEVETDILTGNVQVKRVDILEDTGESMSPGIDVGQIEGAFVMGIGYYLTEALVYDNESGALLTDRTWTYKPPGAKDIPIDFRINFLQKSANPAGVLRSKATGEPALNMAIVVLFALRDALRSARKDAGLPDEWIPLGTPTTPDQVYLLAGNKIEQYLLN